MAKSSSFRWRIDSRSDGLRHLHDRPVFLINSDCHGRTIDPQVVGSSTFVPYRPKHFRKGNGLINLPRNLARKRRTQFRCDFVAKFVGCSARRTREKKDLACKSVVTSEPRVTGSTPVECISLQMLIKRTRRQEPSIHLRASAIDLENSSSQSPFRDQPCVSPVKLLDSRPSV
jgi:hypothetical protein